MILRPIKYDVKPVGGPGKPRRALDQGVQAGTPQPEADLRTARNRPLDSSPGGDRVGSTRTGSPSSTASRTIRSFKCRARSVLTWRSNMRATAAGSGALFGSRRFKSGLRNVSHGSGLGSRPEDRELAHRCGLKPPLNSRLSPCCSVIPISLWPRRRTFPVRRLNHRLVADVYHRQRRPDSHWPHHGAGSADGRDGPAATGQRR